MKKLSLFLAIVMLVSLCLASCAKEPVDTPFSPGTIVDNVYTSDWLGLSFTPTDTMEMMSEDELEAFMQTDDSMYTTDEATGEKKLDYSKVPTVYEMVATDVETNCSVLIMAQYADETMTIESYIETVRTQLDDLLVAENDLGTANFSEITTKKLAGREYTVFAYAFETNGMTFGQTMYIDKIEDRIANICITHGNTEELEEFLACFSRK
ncbi:MAG: hypothetical protein IJY93_06920 [Clostridia bacterium]|nr:hypothetical protein [Clostridia bacterium]